MLLKKEKNVFFLNSSVKRQFERTKDSDKRPLLNKGNNLKVLEELYNKRLTHYENVSRYQIEMDDKTNEEVIDIATSDEKEVPEDNFGVILDDAEVDNEDETLQSEEDVEPVTQEEESSEEEEITPEEKQRVINTEVFKRDGWLDDVDTNTKK